MKVLKLILCSSVFALAGCGGGEGGSDNIEFKPDTLQFTAAQNQPITAQTVSINVGTSSSQRYVDVQNKTPNIASLSEEITHIDALKVTVRPFSTLAKGTHNGEFEVLVCGDSACRDVDDRGTFKYTVTIN